MSGNTPESLWYYQEIEILSLLKNDKHWEAVSWTIKNITWFLNERAHFEQAPPKRLFHFLDFKIYYSVGHLSRNFICGKSDQKAERNVDVSTGVASEKTCHELSTAMSENLQLMLRKL